MFNLKDNRYISYFLLNFIFVVITILLLATYINSQIIEAEKKMNNLLITEIAEVKKKENINILDDIYLKNEADIYKQVKDKLDQKAYLDNSEYTKIHIVITANIILFILATLLILVIFNISLTNIFQIKYMNRIDEFIESVINSEFDIFLDETGEGVASKLNTRFNKMARVVSRNYTKNARDNLSMKDSLADISHQLKTPLTSISMNNEILKEDSSLSEDQKDILTINEVQIHRLKWLIDSLLKLSKLDSNTVVFNKKDANIAEMVKDFDDILKKQLVNGNLSLALHGQKNTDIYVDPLWTKEAILNIVKNACEHAVRGSIVEMTIINNVAYKGIEIFNKGKQISLDELTKIFKRFFKSKDNNNSESVGIGLNLSKSIIESQGGSISVSNEPNGVKFTVLFINE